MHQGHDHNSQGNDAGADAEYGGPGHNHAHRPRHVTQWQSPHSEPGDSSGGRAESDIDKVETAFVEAFMDATDPTSFLRLSHVPFAIVAADGTTLNLLRVEIEAITDVGSLTPHIGGASFRYDPLPASLASRRRRLGFVYFDGSGLRRLTFAEIRGVSRSLG
jgi:hypothetical protein